jgi:hypothetical protein
MRRPACGLGDRAARVAPAAPVPAATADDDAYAAAHAVASCDADDSAADGSPATGAVCAAVTGARATPHSHTRATRELLTAARGSGATAARDTACKPDSLTGGA